MPFRRLIRAAVLALAVTGTAHAQEIRFFQIGTGPTGEAVFPIGGLIANAVTNPPGSRQCDKGGSCGVPGLVAVAKSTAGSLANIDAIAQGRLDAALVRADIAYWAFHGTGIYKGKGAVKNLRGIAMLYPESLHLVARKDANIRSVADLRGKRVSFGEAGGGTRVHGLLLLKAFGLTERQLRLRDLLPGPAADALAAGRLDAMLVIDLYPVPVLADLARTTAIDLVPLTGPRIDKLKSEHPFLAAGRIPGATYQDVTEPVETLEVGVALVTGAEQPHDLIYGVTRALRHPSTRILIAQGFPRGTAARLDAQAIANTGIQLHGGASAYYFDAGTR